MFEKIIQRVIRIVKFDMTVYKEIEHDENANVEAALVVVVASLLSAIGAAIASGRFGPSLLRLFTGVLLNWLLWSYVTMFVGTRFFKGEATFWEMARTLGYANAPVALGILSAIGCLGAIIGLAAWVLSLIVGFFAVREALDLPTDKAVITVIIGWVVIFIINLALAGLRIAF